MMIGVKGTKGDVSAAPAAARWVIQSSRASRTPYVFALALIGLASYLKSFFTSQAQAREPQRRDEAADNGESPPDDGMTAPDTEVAERAMQSDEEITTGTVAEPPSMILGSGQGLVPAHAPAQFVTVDTADIASFVIPETPVRLWSLLPPFEQMASNDNLPGGGNRAPGGVERPEGGGWWPIPGGTGMTPRPTAPIARPPESEHTDPTGPDYDPDPDLPDPDEQVPCPGGPGSSCDDDDEGPYSPNRAPRISGPVYLTDLASCAILVITLMDLLRNASDPDGDVLRVANLSTSSGTMAQTGAGWSYSADPAFSGAVTINYRVTDGELFVEQTAHFSVVETETTQGDQGDDNLLGTDGADDIDGADGHDNIDARGGDDVISGGAGNDHIVAGAGNDVVFAGDGDDIVFGGDGDDVIYGGRGDDRLFGDAGNDVIHGEAGADRIQGGTGDDVLYGGGGDDRLDGNEGHDRIFGGAGNDTLKGDTGNDYLDGGEGDDVVRGGAGDDVVRGGKGNDVVIGGEGDDVLHDGHGRDVVEGGAGNDRVIAAMDGADDTYDGGEGCDILDYSGATEDLVINLVDGTASGIDIGTDTITGFETIVAGDGDDHIILSEDPVTMYGGAGDDIFEFIGPPHPDAQVSETRFEIMDFKAGDRVRMSKYDLFEKVFDKFEDEFEKIYGDDVDDDDVRIRYRHEEHNSSERTIIEADFNRDNVYETTISLDGRHLLLIVEHA